MDQEMGPDKAKVWRESKKFQTRPCSSSGSRDPEPMEHCVPNSCHRVTTSVFASFTIHVDADDIWSDDRKSFTEIGTATTIEKKTYSSTTVVKTVLDANDEHNIEKSEQDKDEQDEKDLARFKSSLRGLIEKHHGLVLDCQQCVRN